VGQLAVGLMTRPPREGDASYATYQAERDAILSGMKFRATMLREALNQLQGVSCADIQGAMYAFPTITLSGQSVGGSFLFIRMSVCPSVDGLLVVVTHTSWLLIV
jgi:aspartate/methionine/tyrosine aminotransferase